MASQLKDVIVEKPFSVRGKMRHPGERVTLTNIEADAKVDAEKASHAPKEATTMVIMSVAVGELRKDEVAELPRGQAELYLEGGQADKWGPRRGRVPYTPETPKRKKPATKKRRTTKTKPKHDTKIAPPPSETKDKHDTKIAPPPSETKDKPTPSAVPDPAGEETPLPFDDFKALIESSPGDARAHARLFSVKARGLVPLAEKYKAMLDLRAS